jgi:hypothetical protein
MKVLQFFEIFDTTYPLAEDNVLRDLNRYGGFIQERFSLFSHFTL